MMNFPCRSTVVKEVHLALVSLRSLTRRSRVRVPREPLQLFCSAAVFLSLAMGDRFPQLAVLWPGRAPGPRDPCRCLGLWVAGSRD